MACGARIGWHKLPDAGSDPFGLHRLPDHSYSNGVATDGRFSIDSSSPRVAGMVPERAQHAAGDHGHAGAVHAARAHALVTGLQDHRDAVRLQHVVDGVGDLRSQALLDLQPARVHVHHPGQLADPHHATARQVGDVGAADDRHHVVLAVALEADVAQQNDLVVVVHLGEGAAEQRHRVDGVAPEELLVGAHHAGRRVVQSFAGRVLARPAQQGAHRLLRLRARGAVARRVPRGSGVEAVDQVHDASARCRAGAGCPG